MTTLPAPDITAVPLVSLVVAGSLELAFNCPEQADNYARDLSLSTSAPIMVSTEWQFYRDGCKGDRAFLSERFLNGECIG